ncbi:hypothetical protein HAP47_0000305 [Bradyrhizobium sp. 41S5]|uniref:hypothetical protein n=1 Tax=Bradyrhizobium sp. 41S5 TaxID=1404443 RepID=UPI00156AF5CE|nr:hypothetical protein [Bradyrhizobium sp. 41S5]UFX45220.1 hypothetical protein HAP47_0000305 [Bradyrhizobium sp. 41S5]
MVNLAGWLIGLGIGAVVAGATFVIASRLSQMANPGSWRKAAIIAGAIAAVAVFKAGFSGLFENTLDCANAPTQNLVFKIAEQHSALVLAAVSGKGAFTQDDWDNARVNAHSKILSDPGDPEKWERIEAARVEAKNSMQYTLDVIRTTRKDRETGNIACAATLQGTAGKFGTWALPITYTVERTSDGKLYVIAYGLTGESTRMR